MSDSNTSNEDEEMAPKHNDSKDKSQPHPAAAAASVAVIEEIAEHDLRGRCTTAQCTLLIIIINKTLVIRDRNGQQ